MFLPALPLLVCAVTLLVGASVMIVRMERETYQEAVVKLMKIVSVFLLAIAILIITIIIDQ